MATYTTPIQDAPLDLSLPRRAEGLVASFTEASEGVADLRDFQDEEVFIPEVPESRPVTPTATQSPTNCQYVQRERAYERARASIEHDRFFGGAGSSANLALEIATIRADELRDEIGLESWMGTSHPTMEERLAARRVRFERFMRFADAWKAERQHYGVSQRTAARGLGVNASTVSRFENGRFPLDSLERDVPCFQQYLRGAVEAKHAAGYSDRIAILPIANRGAAIASRAAEPQLRTWSSIRGNRGRPRKRISAAATAVLERRYRTSQYPRSHELTELAGLSGLRSEQVRSWFSHHRSKMRRTMDWDPKEEAATPEETTP